MIFLLHGPDTYRLQQRIHYYREGFKKKYDPPGYNISVLDGATLSLEQLRSTLGQTGFLSAKRLVIVRNVMSQSKKKTLAAEIVQYLTEEWSDDNVLIFVEEEPTDTKGKKPRRNKLRTYLEKDASVESFPLLTGGQLLTWIDREVKKRGGSIERPAVGELAAYVGSDLWNMASEIEKLVNWKAGSAITVDDVRQMVRAQFDDNIFHLTDAIVARDGTLTTKLLHEQFASGSHELYVLKMLIRQFRIMLQVQAIAAEEAHPSTIASRLKLHPFVAKKALHDIQRFSAEELAAIYQQLLDMDIALKRSSQNPRLLFDLLVTRICQSAENKN